MAIIAAVQEVHPFPLSHIKIFYYITLRLTGFFNGLAILAGNDYNRILPRV